MENEYNLPEETNENKAEEPALGYSTETEMFFSPPLTEEELAEALTTEQVQEYLHNLINKLYEQ